jgi:hypothetical protein
MPTRDQTITDAIRIFNTSLDNTDLSATNAWLGIYQALLWYEPVNWLGYTDLPHIIDADKLRPNSLTRRQSWVRPSIWQRRGEGITNYLADQLTCSAETVKTKVDLLMKQPEYEGMQRQNTLGIAFVGLVRHILERLGVADISYDIEVDAARLFPGITFPGRSSTPRIDLLAKRNEIPLAIISAKWSLRHDRLSDLTMECPVYKAAYERIYRRTRQNHLLYFVITNEYDPSRLNKILNDSCVDGVVHVHKTAVVDICGLDGRLEQLIDLSDFVTNTFSW